MFPMKIDMLKSNDFGACLVEELDERLAQVSSLAGTSERLSNKTNHK